MNERLNVHGHVCYDASCRLCEVCIWNEIGWMVNLTTIIQTGTDLQPLSTFRKKALSQAYQAIAYPNRSNFQFTEQTNLDAVQIIINLRYRRVTTAPLQLNVMNSCIQCMLPFFLYFLCSTVVFFLISVFVSVALSFFAYTHSLLFDFFFVNLIVGSLFIFLFCSSFGCCWRRSKIMSVSVVVKRRLFCFLFFTLCFGLCLNISISKTRFLRKRNDNWAKKTQQ